MTMETIVSYIENIFKSLPQTDEIIRLKFELLGDMEAKYLELCEGGASEHEAVFKVISEFGNIEELLDELDLPHTSPAFTAPSSTSATAATAAKEPLPEISEKISRDFLLSSKKTSRFIATGVALCLIGASFLVAMVAVASISKIESTTLVGLIVLLLLVTPAVALFIYSGSLTEKYSYIEQGKFTLSPSSEQVLKAEYEQKNPRFMIRIAVGVCLCLLGVIVMLTLMFVLNDDRGLFGVCALLLFVTVAVVLLITTAMNRDAYQKLLKTGDYVPERQEADKVIGIVASIWWPLVICVFLIWGFVFDGWSISWIILPISGILFGAFAAFYSGITGKNNI